MDKFQAQDRLAALAQSLREQIETSTNLPGSDAGDIVPRGVWLGLEDARWLVGAIDAALTDEIGRLDEALGLRGSAGRPRSRANALMAEAWVAIGAPMELTPAVANQVALQACKTSPMEFSEVPSVRQVRAAICASDSEALTREAIEALGHGLADRMRLREQK